MKTLVRLTFASVATLVFSMNADSADAQSFRHVDRLASKLQKQANVLYYEFDEHYRHSSHIRHLLSDSSKIYWKARHIHDVVHEGSLSHLASDLKDIDRAFHHLEGLVRHIEEDARYGIGHIHGRTGHVKALMRKMEDTIHHLRDDVVEIQRRRRHDHDHELDSRYGGDRYGSRRYDYNRYNSGRYVSHDEHRHEVDHDDHGKADRRRDRNDRRSERRNRRRSRRGGV